MEVSEMGPVRHHSLMNTCAAVLAAVKKDPAVEVNADSFQYKGWDDIPTYWPKRLLHIPTMTSLQRTGESAYGQVNAPDYGVISYTWGRWQSKESPSIQINGTSWKVPAVRPDHFTPEMLQAVIDQVGKDTDYLWIDIACIDQENQVVKMDEIGHQIGIFAGAKRMYVWLSQLNSRSLYTNLNDLLDLVAYLYIINDGEEVDLQPAIRHISKCLSFLLEDPWFSSLWTLQESILNRGAMILCRNGKPVPYRESGGHCFLSILANDITTFLFLLDSLEKMSLHRIQDVQEEVKLIRLLSKKAGIQSTVINNPNVQYEFVRYRTTTRPEDRIYGIIQIYQLKVGQSLEPWKAFTVDELRDQFTEALVNRYPLISQLFVHLEHPHPGRSWRITEHCEVPVDYRVLSFSTIRSLCKFRVTTAKSLGCTGLYCSPWSLDFNRKNPPFFQIFLDNKMKEKLPPVGEVTDSNRSGISLLSRLRSAVGPATVVMVPLGYFDPGHQFILLLLKEIGMEKSASWERIGIATIYTDFQPVKNHFLEFQGEIF